MGSTDKRHREREREREGRREVKVGSGDTWVLSGADIDPRLCAGLGSEALVKIKR